MSATTAESEADVCLILEGSYPYVSGGVSAWVRDLLEAQRDLTFHVVALVPNQADLTLRYVLPDNVLSLVNTCVQQPPKGAAKLRHQNGLFERLEKPLLRLQSRGGLSDLAEVIALLALHRRRIGSLALPDSRAAWDMLVRTYQANFPGSSFLDFFWTWRGLLGGLYSVLLSELPRARVYHAASTGYAGLMAARAHLETGRPALLTEHGIYTTERRIEIAMSTWLGEAQPDGFNITKSHRDLKDLWVDSFVSYSTACYQACSKIITLFEENQRSQIEDGAPAENLLVIPNGVDHARYTAIRRDPAPRPPTVAFIGRVVPIKDVKTFIRAVGILAKIVPDVQALVLGPTEEDEGYFHECQAVTAHLGLRQSVRFVGAVQIEEYLTRVDAIALTSLSEAQPLVILEAGAAGVPSVATDVGCCRELILGRTDEHPAVGPGGSVTPLANPAATAEALAKLLTDPDWHQECSRNIQQRVLHHYNKADLDRSYWELYDTYRNAPAPAVSVEGMD